MIDFDFKNLIEVKQKIKDNRELIERVNALPKFEFAISLIEFLRELKVDKFKINFIKDMYDDNGFQEGIFCSIEEKDKPSVRIYEDTSYNIEYDDEFNKILDNPKVKKLNQFLSDIYLGINSEVNQHIITSTLSNNVIKCSNGAELKDLVGLIVGEEFRTDWEVTLEKRKLSQNLKYAKGSVKTKI